MVMSDTMDNQIMLQWGHALSGMDTLVGLRGDLWHSRASMGPCPFRHGYFRMATGYTSDLWLQWGHALSGMDTGPAWYLTRPAIRFNGAMPFQAWIQRGTAGSGRSQQCFNGAMPFQAWIRCDSKGFYRLGACFNGAMPFQAWIHVNCPFAARGDQHASMGPCPFRHGYEV